MHLKTNVSAALEKGENNNEPSHKKTNNLDFRQDMTQTGLLLRTRENFDVFNSLDETYLVFTSKK